MFRSSPPYLSRIALVTGLALLATFLPASSALADPDPTPSSTWRVTPLSGASRVQGAKSASGKLAKSDPALLRSTSPTQTSVMVKLDYDALASYKGDVPGLPATSPSVTGQPLDLESTEASRYSAHIKDVERAFLNALAKKVPEAKAGLRLRTVYGGLAVSLPANKAKDLLRLPGVAAVQQDSRQQPLTDSSPAFIGAPAIYSKLGGAASAGKGIIVGVLDTGAWPEHPSFANPGNLPAPPPRVDGKPRVCKFGDNPLTKQTDVFVCNNKLISGQPFLDTYNDIIGNESYPDSARDSDGHGTHTASTAAGTRVPQANPLGINRGPIQGIAPAAHVAMYKVCGALGCYSSDSVAAVAQAISDGVRVINYSISGGSEPYNDPVELAFLDAYAAGVLVAASAGNSGPNAGTVNHNGPWVTTVAASTQNRTFQSTIRLSGGLTLKGVSLTAGISTALPVVLASAAPYNNEDCTTEPPAGLFNGKIVVCKRGAGRVHKGYLVKKGGAAGMIMYNNDSPLDLMSDNHWLPTVHIDKAAADKLFAHLAANPNTKATFTMGTKATRQGDMMTSFSSRGPGGDFLKPDVTAPGIEILAGNTPTPDSVLGGPPGNLYQAIAGTSMSSPHVAGAAALIFALHPTWTPGQVKSALQTTATTKVTKQDGTTPADPFDFGSGRIDLTKAGDVGLTIDETAENYRNSATNPSGRINLNVPSVNAPAMPGFLTVKRTLVNVTNKPLTYAATGSTVSGARIVLLPSRFTVQPGKSITLNILIHAPSLADGRYFGDVKLQEVNGPRTQHLPVVFYHRDGDVALDQTCTPESITTGGTSTCTVTLRNTRFGQDITVSSVSTVNSTLKVTRATGATVSGNRVTAKATLKGPQSGNLAIAPGTGPADEWLSLTDLGVAPLTIGDEEAINQDVPAFTYGGQTYSRIGIVSNGYIVPGGVTEDAQISYTPQQLPDAAPPNGVLAPYWTDLDGTGSPGVYLATLSNGVQDYIVVEWHVHLYGTTEKKVFQQWIGVKGVEGIWFIYDPANLPGDPGYDYGLTVGVENMNGTIGARISGPPTQNLRVTTTPEAAGDVFRYTYTVTGVSPGTGPVQTYVSSPGAQSATIERDTITVRAR